MSSISLAWVFHTDNILLNCARGLLGATDAAPFNFRSETLLLASAYSNAKMCIRSNETLLTL